MQRGAPSSETGPGEIESRQVDADGNVLQVRREKDGTIEVYRQKHGTNKRETTRYTDIDALRKQDAAAAKLLDEVISADAPDRVGGNAERSTRERRSQDNRRSLQDALRDYMQKYEHQWERRIAPPDSRQWQEWHHRFFVNPPPNAPAPPDNALRGRKRSEADAPPATPPAPVPPGGGETPAERTSFEVRPDGSITAQVDSGGTQLTMSFPDEHAFEQKAPRLYERFKASMELTR